MTYQYKMADICLHLNTPFEINIGKESLEFLSENLDTPAHEIITFQPVDLLDYEENDGHWEAFRWYTQDDVNDYVYHCNNQHKEAYACMCWPKKQDSSPVCKYIEAEIKNLHSSHSICNIIGLETLFLRHEGLLLHSSFIRWNGQSILFSAPSGTGKSTQAELWEKYEGAEVLNGDRSAIRKIDGQWTAYGLPYAGSSGIYRNEKAPIKAIVLLKQASDNQIRRASVAEAVTFLYPEFTIHRWDSRFSEKTLDLILKLLSEIPVYVLDCRPDKGAVEVLKEYMAI